MDLELRWSNDCLSAHNLPLPTSPHDREPLGYTIKTHWLPKTALSCTRTSEPPGPDCFHVA